VSAINNHQIYVVVNDHQVKHQSTILESLGKTKNVKLKIFFYLDAIDIFISPYALYKCEFVACEQDIFKLIEMDCGVRK
jgi:hypothetical protein